MLHILLIVKKTTEHWLELAHYDLRVANHMLKTRSYVYVIFLCHLTVEKMLKACISELTEIQPPKIHDLPKLSNKAALELPAQHMEFITELSDESIATRYPEELGTYDKKAAQECLNNTR